MILKEEWTTSVFPDIKLQLLGIFNICFIGLGCWKVEWHIWRSSVAIDPVICRAQENIVHVVQTLLGEKQMWIKEVLWKQKVKKITSEIFYV